jgi:hypothetical protein
LTRRSPVPMAASRDRMFDSAVIVVTVHPALKNESLPVYRSVHS